MNVVKPSNDHVFLATAHNPAHLWRFDLFPTLLPFTPHPCPPSLSLHFSLSINITLLSLPNPFPPPLSLHESRVKLFPTPLYNGQTETRKAADYLSHVTGYRQRHRGCGHFGFWRWCHQCFKKATASTLFIVYRMFRLYNNDNIILHKLGFQFKRWANSGTVQTHSGYLFKLFTTEIIISYWQGGIKSEEKRIAGYHPGWDLNLPYGNYVWFFHLFKKEKIHFTYYPRFTVVMLH